MNFHNHFSLAGTVTVDAKGKVVIPAEVRQQMSIEPGDKLIALYLDDKKTIAFITEEQAQEYVDKMGQRYTDFKQSVNSVEVDVNLC